jgi:hypothetical protein
MSQRNRAVEHGQEEGTGTNNESGTDRNNTDGGEAQLRNMVLFSNDKAAS